MKISCYALALIVPSASAFFAAPRVSQKVSTTNLASSPENPYLGSIVEDRLGAPERSRGEPLVTPSRDEILPSGTGLWEEGSTLTIQGSTLKTWSYKSTAVDRVHVSLRTEGRPLDADVELWQGPDNTPCKMRVYVENGAKRPFNALVETPRGPNTLAVRNIGQMEFPLDASVSNEVRIRPDDVETAGSQIVQGGALKTYPFESNVDSVQVLLKTDGRPLTARIELLQGPNNNKQIVELYTEDGLERPFFMVIDTPGSGNVVRVVNTSPVEFPMTAWVDPYSIDYDSSDTDVVLGGDKDW